MQISKASFCLISYLYHVNKKFNNKINILEPFTVLLTVLIYNWMLFFSTVQKISPDSIEKIQLQVVLHDGSASTFQFVNPGGRPSQIQDREGIKELMQQLLPKFKKKINRELEEKNRWVLWIKGSFLKGTLLNAQ